MLNRTRWLLGGLLCLALWPASALAQTYRTRTPEEVSSVANGVRGALGIDTRRGDRVYVTHLPFAGAQLRARAERKRKQEERQELLTAVVLNIAKGIAVVLGLLVLRTVVGAIGRSVSREEEVALEVQRELEEGAVGEEVPETPHDILLGRIARLIVERPEDSARLIRTMLIEEARQR